MLVKTSEGNERDRNLLLPHFKYILYIFMFNVIYYIKLFYIYLYVFCVFNHFYMF